MNSPPAFSGLLPPAGARRNRREYFIAGTRRALGDKDGSNSGTCRKSLFPAGRSNSAGLIGSSFFEPLVFCLRKILSKQVDLGMFAGIILVRNLDAYR